MKYMRCYQGATYNDVLHNTQLKAMGRQFSCAPKTFQRVIHNLNEFVDMPLEEVTLKEKLEDGSSLMDNFLWTCKEISRLIISAEIQPKLMLERLWHLVLFWDRFVLISFSFLAYIIIR